MYKAVPGYDIHFLDNTGRISPGQIGNIVVKLPLPPGCFPTLWKNDRDYVKTYLSAYEGYYLTADARYLDDDGYLWIMSRTDDIINVAGHGSRPGRLRRSSPLTRMSQNVRSPG